MSPSIARQKSKDCVPFIPSSYSSTDSSASALQLVLSVRPDWESGEGEVEIVRFTDGITNTLLKCIKARPGLTEEQIDDDAVLLRAYGNGTQLLIDREREFASHTLLARHNLAPPLLGRFQNGLLYRYIRGRVCSAADLGREGVWRGVARRLGEWHAVLPIVTKDGHAAVHEGGQDIALVAPNGAATNGDGSHVDGAHSHSSGKADPNLWTVMQRWVSVLPESSASEAKRKLLLQKELQRLIHEMADVSSLGNDGVRGSHASCGLDPDSTQLVFAHCDLLAGNVVVQPSAAGGPDEDVETVNFIDYEYATPSPAAFDLANHFAEWAGLECDYHAMPSRSQRRDFLREYLRSYRLHKSSTTADHDICNGAGEDGLLEKLFQEVDRFRGVPGFYWGIWALIQAEISEIDFDYPTYAELRLQEYWDWRAETMGMKVEMEKEQPLRERQWGREA